MQRINLPEPAMEGRMTLEEAIKGRRSVRSFSDGDIDAASAGMLLWAAQGITCRSRGFRAAPSAGAAYPLELYLVNAEGVYVYVPSDHALEPVKPGDRRIALSRAALGQGFVAQAPASIVITAVYGRTRRRYGARAERYVHIEAGHAAQNIHLQAVALGLASVPVGAFRDEEVSDILSLPGDRSPLYIIPVGRPR